MTAASASVAWARVEGRRASAAGVVFCPDSERGETRWLSPLPWIAVGTADVSAARERVVAENAWFTQGINIDYGNTCGLCGDIEAQQEALVEEVLASAAGLRRGEGFAFEDRAKVLAGPGAVYHVDHGVGLPTALFVITSLTGAAVLDFPQIGLELSLEPGVTVLFDALQVHGLRRPDGGGIGVTPFVVVTRTVLVGEDGARRLKLLAEQAPDDRLELDVGEVDGETGAVLPGNSQ